MDRIQSVCFWSVWLLVYYVIGYYGIRLSIWSSIVLSLFFSDILLFFAYPPSNLGVDPVDWSLYVYVSIVFVSLVIFLIYILQKTLSDRREA